jgi:hypothetical protein
VLRVIASTYNSGVSWSMVAEPYGEN